MTPLLKHESEFFAKMYLVETHCSYEMLQEILFPKELKRVIADLDERSELDDEAIGRLCTYISKRLNLIFLLGVPFLLIVVIFSQHFFLIALSMGLILWFAYSVIKENNSLLRKYPVLYATGNECSATVINYSHGNEAWGIKYKYKVAEKEHLSDWFLITSALRSDSFQKEDNIQIYYNPDKPEESVPVTSKLFDTFNLKRASDMPQDE